MEASKSKFLFQLDELRELLQLLLVTKKLVRILKVVYGRGLPNPYYVTSAAQYLNTD